MKLLQLCRCTLINHSALPVPENGQAAERLVSNVFCIYVVVLNMQGMVFPSVESLIRVGLTPAGFNGLKSGL